MEPLSREERNSMKQNGNGVTDRDIEEYEQLLVQRHWERSDAQTALREVSGATDRRIDELYQKLYETRST